MSQVLPVPASTLLTLIENVVTHTRPATSVELLQSLNFGIGKIARAIQSVRPQAFLSFVDPFTLVAGQSEYDLGIFSPPVDRPLRLTLPTSTTPSILFRYRALMDPEFEARDGRASSTTSGFFYDVLSGLFPRTPIQFDTSALATAEIIFVTGVDPAADFALMQARFPLRSVVLLPGGLGNGQDLYAQVVSHLTGAGSVSITVSPSFVSSVVVEAGAYGDLTEKAIVPIWTRMLKLAPTPATSYAGRLYYDYAPDQITSEFDLIDGQIAKYRDAVVEYAIAQLLKGTADTMHRDHLEAANELRAECMQAVEPLSGQNTESLGSGLGDD